MANYIPLNLYDCEFRDFGESRHDENPTSDLTEWVYEETSLRIVIETLQGQWSLNSVK